MMARPIGVLKMVDQGEADDKIIAVHADDPEYQEYTSLRDLPKHRMIEVKRFFEDYKTLERKHVKVKNFLPKDKALDIIRSAIALYKKVYPR
jgi:inorganic pyrophosphatase